MSDFTHGRPGITQVVASGVASTQSAVIPPNIFDIRLFATQNCCFKMGMNPTATDQDVPLAAGVPEYFKITTGEKIAVIQLGADAGSLYITYMSG